MNKWAMYWMLHCVGFVGLAASALLLPHSPLPAWLMGGIGGGWMAGWMIAARFLVIRSKTPNVAGNRLDPVLRGKSG
jgi:hypothetical protein